MSPLYRSTKAGIPRGRAASGAARVSKASDSVGDVLLRPSPEPPPPERAAAESVKPTDTVGGPGFAAWGGFIASRERDPTLQGVRRYEVYGDQLANSELVATGVAFFLDLLSKPQWTFDPADESPEAKRVADFVAEAFDQMATPLTRVVRRGGLYRFYGFSLHEWTASVRPDGKLGLLDVEVRPQLTIERWDTDQFGVVHGAWQRMPSTSREVYLPRAKLLHFVDDSISDSPEGFGVFRSLVPAVRRLQAYEKLEGLGFEIDLRGIPVLRGPIRELELNAKLSKADRDKAMQALKDFAEGHIKAKDLALILDSEVYANPDGTTSAIQKWSIELLQGGATSTESIGLAIQRVQLGIARRLNITHMMLGGSGGGAFALSEDQSINFGLTVDSCLSEMAHTVDRELIVPLVLLNGWPRELAPRSKTSRTQWRTIQELASFVRDMSVAGVQLAPEDDVVGDLFEFAGLRRPTNFAAPLDPLDAGLMPGKGDAPPFGGKGGGAPANRVAKAFDPNQPRDEDGKWGDGGGRSSAAPARVHTAGSVDRAILDGDAQGARIVAAGAYRELKSAMSKSPDDSGLKDEMARLMEQFDTLGLRVKRSGKVDFKPGVNGRTPLGQVKKAVEENVGSSEE